MSSVSSLYYFGGGVRLFSIGFNRRYVGSGLMSRVTRFSYRYLIGTLFYVQLKIVGLQCHVMVRPPPRPPPSIA